MTHNDLLAQLEESHPYPVEATYHFMRFAPGRIDVPKKANRHIPAQASAEDQVWQFGSTCGQWLQYQCVLLNPDHNTCCQGLGKRALSGLDKQARNGLRIAMTSRRAGCL